MEKTRKRKQNAKHAEKKSHTKKKQEQQSNKRQEKGKGKQKQQADVSNAKNVESVIELDLNTDDKMEVMYRLTLGEEEEEEKD